MTPSKPNLPPSSGEKGKSQRPLSPHLQIYRPQMTSVLSILHRLTGIGLVLCLFPLAYWLWALGEGAKTYHQAVAFFSYPLIRLCCMGATLAFLYHGCNGIRYLIWGLGRGYEKDWVKKSGWMVLGLSLLLTLVLWGRVL